MNTLALCIADEANEYQQMIKEDTLAAASRAGMRLEVFSADGKVTQQIRQVYECLHRAAEDRPRAIMIMAVRVNALGRVAREALQAGIGWFCLNRRMEELSNLRQEFPHLPVAFISPDHREIGKIQGRQFRALLPQGGRLLYVQGEATSTPAQDRLTGMREVIQGGNLEIAGVLDGNWTTEDSERVLGNWLRMVMSGKAKIDLIGCQNDAMAMGAVKARQAVADYLRKPEISRIPVTGCDGVRSFGQKLVSEGQLAATVIMPSTGGPAVQLLTRALNHGEAPPEEVMLPPTSFPTEAALAQRAR
jgi:ABC-type sugar transport system substrate-binding protein